MGMKNWAGEWLCVVLALTLLGMSGALRADELQPVGPAFTSPQHQEKMPGAWSRRPINRSGWPPGTDIAVTLDQHLYPALLPLVREYAEKHHLRIAVEEGTCGISAGKLLDRTADIGGFCCPPGDTDRLPGLRFHTLGIAPLAIIVNPANPLGELSFADAQKVFDGLAADWTQLPGYPQGAPQPITPVGRLHCKSRPGHWRLLLDNEDQFSANMREVSTINDMVAVVGRNPGAVGYETLWMLSRYKDLGAVKTLRIGGVAPGDEAAVLAGRYPLYRTYNITTWETAPARRQSAERLVAFIERNFARVDPRFGLISAAKLRAAGWQFNGDELIGTPR